MHLLGQLQVLADDNFEVLVVDNASTDGTSDAIREKYPQVTLLTQKENAGVGARNRGLEQARGEIILCLDDDMVDVRVEDLNLLRDRFTKEPELGGLCLKVTWPGSSRVRDWVHRRPPSFAGDTFPTYEITEGAVAWRLEALHEVGFYREDFFISHEGLDLAYRLLNKGWNIVYDGRAAVGHDHASGGRASWRRYYYDTRNLFWIAALHQPFFYGARYLFLGVSAMFVYALRDRHLWAWVRGVYSGLARTPAMHRERRPWNRKTTDFISEADSWRPGFWTMVRKRLGQSDFSME
jgi:GT2 family glycosyltransferase